MTFYSYASFPQAPPVYNVANPNTKTPTFLNVVGKVFLDNQANQFHSQILEVKEYPNMARAKSPSGSKAKKENNGVSVPVTPDVNPATAETPATGVNQVVATTPKVEAASAAAAAPQAAATIETRKFELHKTEPRKNVIPINMEDEIRRRAYEIFQQRGQASGGEAEDWLAAEREVMQRYRQQRA
jgi:hypothetical protein